MKTRAGRSLGQFLNDTIATCPPLAERLKGAKMVTEAEATGNFSYVSERNHGSNYLLLGDAYAFIDPVFSSGVMLAMNSGFEGAKAIDACLSRPREAAAALKQFDHVMKHGPKAFSWFIYRITNPTMRDIFMAPRNIFRVKEALLSVLAGDIFGKTPIWTGLCIFKVIYYLSFIGNFRQSLAGWQRRRVNIKPVDETGLGVGR